MKIQIKDTRKGVFLHVFYDIRRKRVIAYLMYAPPAFCVTRSSVSLTKLLMELFVYFSQLFVRHMGVNLRCRDIAMP